MSERATSSPVTVALHEVEAVIGLAIDGRDDGGNPLAARLLGSQPLDAVLSDASQDKLTDALLRAPCGNVELTTRDGGTWDVTVVPTEDGVVLAVRDVSRYATAAAQLATSNAELAARNRELEVRTDIGDRVWAVRDPDELVRVTTELAAELLAVDAVAVTLAGHERRWSIAGHARSSPDGRVLLPNRHGEGQLTWWREAPFDDVEVQRLERLAEVAARRADQLTSARQPVGPGGGHHGPRR